MSVSLSKDVDGKRTPRYRQIADELVHEVRSGAYPVGKFLPTENDLASRFDTSRQTVREALRVLAEKGLILRKAGSGTLVVDKGERPLLNLAVGNIAQLLSYPRGVSRQHLESSQFITDEASAELLGCAPGKLWIRLRCIRFEPTKHLPMGWVDIFILPKYAAVLSEGNSESTTIVQQIESRFGLVVECAEVDVSVTRIDEAMAAALQTEIGCPALRIVRRYLDSSNEPFEVTVSTHPEDRYAYRIMLR